MTGETKMVSLSYTNGLKLLEFLDSSIFALTEDMPIYKARENLRKEVQAHEELYGITDEDKAMQKD